MHRVAFVIVAACATGAAIAACSSDESSPGPADAGSDAAHEASSPPPPPPGDGGPPPPAPGPVDPDTAARAAVVLGSCVPDDGIHRYLADIYYEKTTDPERALIFHDAVQCLATHGGGCDAIKACTGASIDVVPTANDCARGCAGSVATDCDGRLRFQLDCSRFGEACTVVTNDGGTTRVGCVPPSAPACPLNDAGFFQSECENGQPTYCDLNVEELGPRCTDFGLACQGGECRGTGGACTGDSTGDPLAVVWTNGVACNGGTLQACINGGLATTTCTSIAPSFTCQSIAVDGGPPRVYCGLGAACTPPSRSNLTCDGDKVVVCNAGRIDEIDCKALGFTGCNPQAGGCIPNLYTQAGLIDGG